MAADSRNPDVLTEVVARVLAAGASEFEVEYKSGKEHVVAYRGPVGIGITDFPSTSEDTRKLRSQLYAVSKKRRNILHAGTEYGLRVKVFDSFGEDAFRVTITMN